tara:strand:+ start:3470 stop:3685 length:216 start_codon:yes stop_codon:yes gene_type:complete
MNLELPHSYQSTSKKVSYLGVALFGLTSFVLIYQIYFYQQFIKNLKKNGDVNERLARLERIISDDNKNQSS